MSCTLESRSISEKLVRQMTGVRIRRIRYLKNKISTGKYRISAIDLAKALLMGK
jgi:anti-sigma28 factor (negative regulator of flagellin synthesis)